MWLYSSGIGQGLMVGSCEHCHKLPGAIKCGKFLDWPRTYTFVKRDFTSMPIVNFGSGGTGECQTIISLWPVTNVFFLNIYWTKYRCVMSCVCNLVLSFSAVFCVVTAMHKFHFRAVINWVPNKWWQVKHDRWRLMFLIWPTVWAPISGSSEYKALGHV